MKSTKTKAKEGDLIFVGAKVMFHPKGRVEPHKGEYFTILNIKRDCDDYKLDDLALVFNHALRTTMWIPVGDLVNVGGASMPFNICNYYKEDFLDIKPFQSEVVMFVLASLGGRAHLEDLAIRCHDIRPSLFQWDKFPYPNREKARNALSELKGTGLAEGQSNVWWLTLGGIERVHKRRKQLANLSKTDFAPDQETIDQIIFNIKESAIYGAYERSGDNFIKGMGGGFYNLIGCSPDMPDAIIRSKTAAFCWEASLLGEDMWEFAKACFNEYIGGRE